MVIGAIAGNLFSCSLAAYAFARLKFRFRTLWFAIMLVTIMLPFHVSSSRSTSSSTSSGWVNTYVPLVLPKFLATDAFFVFLMVQFIRGMPRELDEAARIDGCGHFRIFCGCCPLMGPALATTAIFTFIWTWNDFFTPLIYLTDPDMYTVPVALRSFLDATRAATGARCSPCRSSLWCRCSWRSCSARGSSSRASPPPAASRPAPPRFPRSTSAKALISS